MKLRSMALGGVGGILGLGLIGVGAHATFTTAATAHQTVSAGTLGIVLYSPSAYSGNNTSTLTLGTISNAGSSFLASSTVTVINSGSNTIKHLALTSTANPLNTLAKSVGACIVVRGTNKVIFHGGADDVTANRTVTLGPSAKIPLVVQLYAGTETTLCGATQTTVTPLPSGALGQSATFNFHVVGTG